METWHWIWMSHVHILLRTTLLSYCSEWFLIHAGDAETSRREMVIERPPHPLGWAVLSLAPALSWVFWALNCSLQENIRVQAQSKRLFCSKCLHFQSLFARFRRSSLFLRFIAKRRDTIYFALLGNQSYRSRIAQQFEMWVFDFWVDGNLHTCESKSIPVRKSFYQVKRQTCCTVHANYLYYWFVNFPFWKGAKCITLVPFVTSSFLRSSQSYWLHYFSENEQSYSNITLYFSKKAYTTGVLGFAANTLWNWTWRDIFQIVRSR